MFSGSVERASVTSVLLVLCIAVWVAVFALKELSEPRFSWDQAVAAGHAEIVEHTDGTRSVRWLPDPTINREITRRQGRRIEELDGYLRERIGVVAALEDRVSELSAENEKLMRSVRILNRILMEAEAGEEVFGVKEVVK